MIMRRLFPPIVGAIVFGAGILIVTFRKTRFVVSPAAIGQNASFNLSTEEPVHQVIQPKLSQIGVGIPNRPSYFLTDMEKYAINLEIVKKALIPPPTTLDSRAEHNTGSGRTKFFSQFGQDKWVAEKIYPGKYNGRYIESGAFDGTQISNTRHFDLYYNWTGLLIEPDPGQFRQLKKAGRNAWLLHGCIGSDPIEIQKLKFVLGGPGGFVASMRGSFNMNVPYNKSSLLTVNCYPINLILDAIGWTGVDYWSLDIEGGEPAVLQAVDFKRFRFGLIDIECAGCGGYLDPKLPMQQTPQMAMRFFTKHFLELKGYKEVGIVHHDLMYRSANESYPLSK